MKIRRGYACAWLKPSSLRAHAPHNYYKHTQRHRTQLIKDVGANLHLKTQPEDLPPASNCGIV